MIPFSHGFLVERYHLIHERKEYLDAAGIKHGSPATQVAALSTTLARPLGLEQKDFESATFQLIKKWVKRPLKCFDRNRPFLAATHISSFCSH